ncbi:MAG: guanylate kinase [Bdellovibrionales bacterium]|nr:guanylate kinase [Bdellovibrionales bacterium]
MSSKKACFIVISGPSGVGKTRFIEKSLKTFPQLSNTISFTTRKPRPNEKSANFYYFISKKEFEEKKEKKEFLEWAVVHNELYGTSKKEVERLWDENKAIIKDIDVQGFLSVKNIYPHSRGIFIYPPSMDELKKRILKRGEKISEEKLKIRLDRAVQEMSHAHFYDFKIINDQFEIAWRDFKILLTKQLDQFNLLKKSQ